VENGEWIRKGKRKKKPRKESKNLIEELAWEGSATQMRASGMRMGRQQRS
jgi:hypothetical protein